jgi:hypothetical protein
MSEPERVFLLCGISPLSLRGTLKALVESA